MDAPLFSVVIPTFNAEKTICNALKSLVTQTFVNFEIIVVDGISEDRTLEVINEFNDQRIKVVAEPDNGIYGAHE